MVEAQPVPLPPPPVASVPQEKTPVADALTSQLAELRPETMSEVVEAVPETVSAVVEAYGKVEARLEVEVMVPPTKRFEEM